jgi:hypothetical protein
MLTTNPQFEADEPSEEPIAFPDDALWNAARLLFRSVSESSREYAPDISSIVQEIGLDRINGRTPRPAGSTRLAPTPDPLPQKISKAARRDYEPLSLEAVIEVLEYTADYIDISPPEVGFWLRLVAERGLIQRFGRETAASLLRRYVDPAPPGDPPYTEDGILQSIDLSERANVPWLVDGMVQAGTVGMWVAPFSSGKTFGAVALGLALAFGREWMGQETRGGGHVRYIAAEGLSSFDRRLAGWLVRHELLAEDFTREEMAGVLAGRFSLSDGGLRLDDLRLEEVLVHTLQEAQTRLLVLDTLGRLLGVGQSDEDNAVANSVMGVLHRAAAVTGCTILIIHHPGHTQTHRARGASAWAQAADWVIVSKGNLRAGGDAVRMMNTKQRDAELFDDAAYRLRPMLLSCEGEQWRSAIFEPASVALTKEIPLALRIRYDVQAHPGSSMREVRARVKGDNGEIGDEIIRLVSASKLKNNGSGNSYSLHDNPEEWGDDPLIEFAASEEYDLSDLTGDHNQTGD